MLREANAQTMCSARHRPRRGNSVHRGVRPEPEIYRTGWKLLDDAGVELRDFSPDLRARIRKANATFLTGFVVGQGDSGRATFDYLQNGSRFKIETDSVGTFDTRWSSRSESSIYLYNGDPLRRVANPRHARAFHKIDDPGAYDFGAEGVALDEGDIGIVPNPSGFLLVRVTDVLDASRGDPRWELSIEWEARLSRQAGVTPLA